MKKSSRINLAVILSLAMLAFIFPAISEIAVSANAAKAISMISLSLLCSYIGLVTMLACTRKNNKENQ